MNILAFDTCLDACSAAVGRGGDGAVYGARDLMRRGHAEALMPMIEHVMAEAGLGFGDIDRIAVTHGPGTFTGTRLGISAALGFAVARAIPVATVSSLAVVARGAAMALGGAAASYAGIAVVRDARRERVYLEITDNGGRSAEGPRLLALDDALAAIEGRGLFAFGSGVGVLEARAERPIAGAVTEWPVPPPEAVDEPDARFLLDFAAGLPVSLDPAPLYLRPPDAKPAAPLAPFLAGTAATATNRDA
jgi:tRNA threonylcarbamoyladenosine biosynthesis protein TsaB